MRNRTAQHHTRKGAENSAVSFFPQHTTTKIVPSFSYLPYDYVMKLASAASLPDETESALSFSDVQKPSTPRALSYAELMTNVILNAIRNSSVRTSKGSIFPDAFYDSCVDSLESVMNMPPDDRELSIIHAKQIMMMLKKIGAVTVSRGKAYAVDDSDEIYARLFSSFWELTDWSELFPSMPSTASSMQDDRYFLAELLLSRSGCFLVDDIAADYFSGMTSSSKEMMLYVSFFDFSFFTWMRHFGIVRFCDSRDGRVRAELTEWGRWYLSSVE